MTAPSRLQPGIAFDHGQRPSPCYRLVLLDAAQGVDRAAVHNALGALDEMLRQLADGQVRELEGQPGELVRASAEQFTGLQHLLGFGRRLFDGDVHRPPLVIGTRPDYLAYLPADGPFPALRWDDDAGGVGRGEADIAIQLTAEHQAGVNCAAVEIWKLLEDLEAPLRMAGSFGGFGRRDGRGWLEFHDGVSNMESSHRRQAIEAGGDPPWMAGGTYMAFLRLTIDLGKWRGLSRREQELVVGRDKLTGGALVGTRRDQSGRPCPVAAARPGEGANDRQQSDFRDPPQNTDPLVEASHVHRANQNRGSPWSPAALRMFRQGYDFLGDLDGDRPRVGMNFVSFQRDLAVVAHLLHLPGWLGDVNFGGPVDPGPGEGAPLGLVTVVAGGLYAVPPVATPFPGAELFRSPPDQDEARAGPG